MLPPTCGLSTLDHVLVSSWIAPLFSQPSLLHTGRSDHTAVSIQIPTRPCSLRGQFPSTVRPITAPERKDGPLEWKKEVWVESWGVTCASLREDCELDLSTGLRTRPLSLPEPSTLTPASLEHIALGDLYSSISHASEIYLCKFAKVDETKWSQHIGMGKAEQYC